MTAMPRPAPEPRPNARPIYLDYHATTPVDPRVVDAMLLRPLIEERWSSGAVRPLFAGPLRTMIQWEAWR